MSIHSPGYQQALIIERDLKATPWIDQGGGKGRDEVIDLAFIQPQSCSAPIFDELPH
jgi:hypothetical protein